MREREHGPKVIPRRKPVGCYVCNRRGSRCFDSPRRRPVKSWKAYRRGQHGSSRASLRTMRMSDFWYLEPCGYWDEM